MSEPCIYCASPAAEPCKGGALKWECGTWWAGKGHGRRQSDCCTSIQRDRLENEVDTLKAELEKWMKSAAAWEKLAKQESRK